MALGQNLRKEIPGLNLKKKKADEKSRITQLHRHSSSQKSLGRSLSRKKNSSVTNLHRQSSTSSMQKIYGRDKSNSGISSPKLSQKLAKKRSFKGSLQRKSLDVSKLKNKRSQSKPPFSGEDTSSFLIKHPNLNSSGIVLKKKTKNK